MKENKSKKLSKEDYELLVRDKVENNFKDQIEFLTQIVNESSVNPGVDAPRSVEVEKKVSVILKTKIKSLGVRTRYLRLRAGRPNVTGVWGPQRARKVLAFIGHMDTARTEKQSSKARVKAGVMYGHGVFDMKASLTAYIYALKAIQDAGVDLSGKIKFAFYADGKSQGASRVGLAYLLNKGFRTKCAILGKPGTDKIAIGHRGGYRFTVTTQGESVNTGLRDWEKGVRGRNAIADMGRVMQALSVFDLPYKVARAFPGRQPVFTFPVKIEGGKSVDVVPDYCKAWGDVRLMPGNTDNQVKMWIQDKLSLLKGVRWSIDDLLYVPSVEIDKNEPIVVSLAKVAKKVLNKNSKIEGCGPWNDGWMLINRDMPCIAGFGPDGGFDEEEWVDLESLKKVTEIYALAAMDYLGIAK